MYCTAQDLAAQAMKDCNSNGAEAAIPGQILFRPDRKSVV